MADLKNIKEGDEFELEMGNGYKAVFKALKVADGRIINSERIALTRATETANSAPKKDVEVVKTEVKTEVKAEPKAEPKKAAPKTASKPVVKKKK